MEIKTCEQYVLTELENAQKLIEELRQQLEDKDLTIQALELQIQELKVDKDSEEYFNQLNIYDFLDNGGFVKVE